MRNFEMRGSVNKNNNINWALVDDFTVHSSSIGCVCVCGGGRWGGGINQHHFEINYLKGRNFRGEKFSRK